MDPFSPADSRKFLLVATYYFTKWVETISLANISETNVKKFLWENIVTRFGIPMMIVADNGPQFKSKKASNKVNIEGLKRRLKDAKGKWVKELPYVLWAFRTTPTHTDQQEKPPSPSPMGLTP